MYTIEIESGTYSGPARRHNGYYAGDFSQLPVQATLPSWTGPVTSGLFD